MEKMFSIQANPDFMRAIGDYIVDRLLPVIAKQTTKSDDQLYDVKGLAAYLNVDENWIYQRTRKHEIPFIKKGKYCLFRKKNIDAWLNQDEVKPITQLFPKRGPSD